MMSEQYLDDVSDLVLLLLLEDQLTATPRESGITRLQKMVFLLTQTLEYRELVARGAAPAVEFEPYRMGPFTPAVYDAVEVLSTFRPALVKSEGGTPDVADDVELSRYVDELDLDRSEPSGVPARPTAFRLTSDGTRIAHHIRSSLPGPLISALQRVEVEYGRLPLRELLRQVYQEYPAMTTRSEIKGQLGLA